MARFAVVLCWVFALLMSSPTSARAASVKWLYDIDVPVADQSTQVRSAAFKQALLVALKRLTGLSDVPMNPAVTGALESPQRYYVEYRYREEDNPVSGAAPATVSVLSVRFAQNAIQKLIADAGLPLWSSNRPTTLAWVAVADGGTRTVVGSNDRTPIAAALRARARERGLPLVLPTQDADEQLEVSAAVVWGGYSQVIEQASERYTPDRVLVGHVTHGASWAADWQLSEHTNLEHFNFDSSTPEAAAAAIVDRLVDQLVAKYAVAGGTQQTLQIDVEGIDDVAQYGALMKYLGGLEVIDSVQVDEVRAHVVSLSLATRTAWDRLRDLLALDGRLQPSEQIDVSATRRVLTWRGDRQK